MQVTTYIFWSFWPLTNISTKFSSQGCLMCIGFRSTVLESLSSCSFDCVRNGSDSSFLNLCNIFFLQSVFCFCAFCVLGLVPCYLSGDSTWRPFEKNSCCGILQSTYLLTYIFFSLFSFAVVFSNDFFKNTLFPPSKTKLSF